MERESLNFDVVIVGGGPAGLSAAIRLAQHNSNYSICVIEKGAYIGAHLLSGAVLDPIALNELIPDWQQKNAPLITAVTENRFYYLTKRKAWKLPELSLMKNKGNYIICLGQFCQWLASQAESLGVNIFPGFSAAKILFDNNKKKVIGIQTRDSGLDKKNEPGPRFQAGVNIYGKKILLAEGARGSLTENIIHHFNLRANCDPQSYGIGVKEVWKINSKHFQTGKVIHTIGWPLDHKTYGGSFLYQYDQDLLSIGLVIGLDYQNPYLDPFQELQRFKLHPFIRPLLEKGECIGYGARALNEGGWQSIPKLTFPGGMLIGCAAGFMNVAKIKGIHTAMKSGILAAESLIHPEKAYTTRLYSSWIAKELKRARNIRPAFHFGLGFGLFYAGLDQFILKGCAPWTFHYQPDYLTLKPTKAASFIHYEKPDGKITFDKMTQVYLTGTKHRENEPCHLLLKNNKTPVDINFKIYDAPEQRYCPAGVYEIVNKEIKPLLQINAANCIHCKTCDIKDPTQNIIWTVPEGGDGPNYTQM